MNIMTPFIKILNDAGVGEMEVVDIEYFDRIILDDKGTEYVVRIWDADKEKATWTLYKMVRNGNTSSGVEVKGGMTIF